MLTFTVVEISSVLDIVRPSNKFYRPMIRTSASVPDDLSPPAPYGATGMAPILVVPMMPYKKEIPTVAKAGGHFRTHTHKSYTKPRQVLSRRSSSPLDDSMTGALTLSLSKCYHRTYSQHPRKMNPSFPDRQRLTRCSLHVSTGYRRDNL